MPGAALKSENAFKHHGMAYHSLLSVWQQIVQKWSLDLKYREPILCVMWPALGSNDLKLDQSGTSIQILPEPKAGHVTRLFFF